MKLIFLSVFLCFVASACTQQDNGSTQSSDIQSSDIGIGTNAPAGFTWGETKQQIESKGIVFSYCSEKELGLFCIADSAPKELPFVKEYKLEFMEGYGLQQVVMVTDEFPDGFYGKVGFRHVVPEMVTDEFPDDFYGHEGKKLYNEIKQLLISKYGQPESSIGTGSGSGEYWVGEGVIYLTIKGLRRGWGNIRVSYLSKDFSGITAKQAANGDIQSSRIRVNPPAAFTRGGGIVGGMFEGAIGEYAPAGFTWGETKQQIKNKGIVFSENCPYTLGRPSLSECVKNPAPKEISFVRGYGLTFLEGYGLQGFVIVTHSFIHDPYGHEGKQLYDEAKQKLISKYGQPDESSEYTGLVTYYGHTDASREIDFEPGEFYQCLASGCGRWSSYWAGEGGGQIGIQLQGERGGTGAGYFRIGYTSILLSRVCPFC